MKSFFKHILIAIVLLGSASCEDFLKEDPKGQLMSDQTFRDVDDLMGSLHALYKQVTRSVNTNISFAWMQMGDDQTTHPAMNKAVLREYDVMTVSDENGHLTINTGTWFWSWKIVKAANFIITCPDNIPGATVADLNLVRGQAHYWRALAYYNMVRLWGPLPISEDLSADAAGIQLSKISEVYEFIIADLLKAEELTQTNYTSPSFAVINGMNVLVSKGAVQATLANVYLTMAGWPLNYGTEYYAKAAAEALKVINGAENGTYYYKMYDDFAQIHSNAENWKNTECILGVYFNGSNGRDGDDWFVCRGAISDFPQTVGGYNDVSSEVKFYVNFPRGRRKDYTYAPVLTLNTGVTLPWWSTTLPEAARKPFGGKTAYMDYNHAEDPFQEYDFYRPFNQQHSRGWCIQTRQVIRLAEVYLWYAEAVGRANLTDQYTRANQLLNAVRNRANGNVDPARNIYNNLAGEQLAKAAWDEHGWEIACWWGGTLAPRFSDQQRMHLVPGYYCPMEHYKSRKLDFETSRKYRIPESEEIMMHRDGVTQIWDGTPVDVGESFGPVEEWREEKMFLPYPKSDAEQINCFKNVDKFSLIK